MTKTIPTARRAAAASLALAALVSAGFYSTSAYFSDSVNGTFSVSTATPDLNFYYQGNQLPSDTVQALTASELYPGSGPVGLSGIQLCNDGDMPLWLQGTFTQGGNGALADALELTISNIGITPGPNLGGAVTVPLSTAQGVVNSNSIGALPDGVCIDFDFAVAFPQDTVNNQNNLSNKTVSGTYTIEGRTSKF